MIPKMLKEMERRAKDLLDGEGKLAAVKSSEKAKNTLLDYYRKQIVEAEGFAEEIQAEYVHMQNVPPDNRNDRYPAVMQEISGDYVYVKNLVEVFKHVVELLEN